MPAPGDRNWPDHEVDEFLDQIAARGEDYRRLVERLPVIVYAAELGETGAWRYVSPQVEEILGYTAEEFKRDPGLWARLLHPDDRESALAIEKEDYLGDRNTKPTEYRMRTRSGDIVWMLDEAVLERDDKGVPVWHGVLYDISERKLAEAELQRALAQQAVVARLGERALKDGDPDQLMQAAVSLISEVDGIHTACIWEVGRDGRRLHLRAGLDEEVIGAGRRVSAARDSHAGAALDSGTPAIVRDWTEEERFTMPPALRVFGAASSLAVMIDGKDRPFGVLDVHATDPSRFSAKDVPFVQGAANVLADAFERHAADQALRHRVLHDSLTGLPNRLSFVDALGEALRRAEGSGSPIGILFLDLDHFKLINDSLGHHAGDALLRAVAPRLRGHLRPGDVVARFGGDEFGILIDRLADEGEAVAIADRVASAFTQPFSIDGVEHFVSSSIGIAVARSSERQVNAELLIRDADAAMYRAKEGGRARCVLFDAEMRAGAMRRLQVERELRHALDRDELALHYQPVVSLRTGEISGLEALVRWQHPERGLLDPVEFVSIAEDSGLIEPLGRWVQERACRQAVEWHQQHPDARPFDVAVNLSARQVAHRDLPATVAEIIARTGIDPGHLRLEITESVLVEESASAIASLEALSEIGVRLVLDDFGTGYSSLAYLNRYPFHALKIDRSFVDALGIEQERTAIVEAIIGMARALSLEVIAEGVENEVQLAELRRLGCDYAQGHLFHAAMPDTDVTRLLREGALGYSGIVPGK
ncbi:MAG TPA: EAL domain-containing protein [Solirubrobacterales bacterium]|jgi:diguanylate cyclase (GGDEF)-like protein/PAS domain S-box-containing protein|nr:EAL domain-containing protein [Solirubrobacterales bacterium]